MALRPGYSLLEIVVVVAIIGVAAGVAAPSLIRTIERNEAHAAIRAVDRVIAEARVEAFAMATPVSAAEFSRRIGTALPEGWFYELNGAPRFDESGWCPGGRLVVRSPRDRLWGFELEPGDCRPRR